MHPAIDDHVRFAIEYPTLLKSAGVVLKDVPMHTAEVVAPCYETWTDLRRI
jgi:hypothetical protein